MKDLFQQLQQTDAKIKDLDRQFDEIDEHPFYIIYNRELEKKIDKEVLRLAIYDQLTLKQTIIENIQLGMTKEMHLISQNQRKLTHLKQD